MGILYYQTNSQGVTRIGVYNTYSAIKKLEKINTLVAETESATRGYLLTRDPVLKQNLEMAHEKLFNAVKEVQQPLQYTTREKSKTTALETLVQKKAGYQKNLIKAPVLTEALLQNLRPDSEVGQITQTIKSLLAAMILDEERLLSERITKNEKDYTTGIYLVLFGSIFAFILVLAVLVQLNRDIFLRKKAEEDVSISENKYRSLIENAGVVVFTADMNGIINFTNNLVSALTGYTREELVGKH